LKEKDLLELSNLQHGVRTTNVSRSPSGRLFNIFALTQFSVTDYAFGKGHGIPPVALFTIHMRHWVMISIHNKI